MEFNSGFKGLNAVKHTGNVQKNPAITALKIHPWMSRFHSCQVLVYPVHIIEVYIGVSQSVTVTAPLIPNLGTKWEWLISHPGHFTPRKNPSTL